MEAHYIAIELKYQNQPLKSGQHDQILNETSNKAKIKKEIDVLETMNIELEHSVAKLRKENETLKQHYKYLYDSIKIMRSMTTEQTTSFLANNAELKAQIQEKVFAIAALKNDLRKLKGHSVDTKFDKTSILGKPVLQSLRNQSVVRQPNAFKSERPKISKPRFASQVEVEKDLSKPVTQHYFPKRIESTFAKLDHMIASSSSRNSSKNMPRFSSNDMVHNHYLDEAKKKTQERDRNLKTSMMPSARLQCTADDSKPKPRSKNQTPRSLPCVFSANHDACITKLLKEVNSRAKIQSQKTRNSNKPVDQKSHTQTPGRQIFTRHRFSPNKTSIVYEKTSPRSDLRWKPMGRIFKSVGLRYEYCKNHKKTVKTGQTQTRERIECTRAEKLLEKCMRTRNSYFPNNSSVTIPRRQDRRRAPNVVEPKLRTIVDVAPMAKNRTMEELLQAPTEGYGEAIVIPEINADHFEIKTNLLQLVQANPFCGFERENPHTHINNFKRITSTLKFRDVPNDVIKLMMFPYSLEGAARVCEAWERFKEMLRACPHHGFTELTQVDTFYNGLNENDQDSLNAAAGGNLLSKTTREALNIIENKSKVRYSRNKSNVSRMNTTSRESVSKTDERIDKLAGHFRP
ncbi:hypothetical protein Tco_0635471 [Tanacetum coccineum]